MSEKLHHGTSLRTTCGEIPRYGWPVTAYWAKVRCVDCLLVSERYDAAPKRAPSVHLDNGERTACGRTIDAMGVVEIASSLADVTCRRCIEVATSNASRVPRVEMGTTWK